MGKDSYRVGGTRGGANAFKWEEIAGNGHQKDRDSYLGACMKASVRGRRDGDRDFFWYNKDTDTLGRKLGETADLVTARRRLELLERKQADSEALADALGETAESRKRSADVELEVSELRALLERGGVERDRLNVERVQGLGAAPAVRHEHVAKAARVEEEIARQDAARREGELVSAINARQRCTTAADAAAPGQSEGGFVKGPANPAAAGENAKRDRKEAKREKKAVKKAAKKAKKEAKKDSKKRKRGDSSSDSD
ncbi:hypothetical protein M885DRAFT_530807 [Pelagophyceae sp. CCMP2097]|nr:hypothetical protein M885DRAFT_530807 [Pelagophyceae sp. CCMP2097]